MLHKHPLPINSRRTQIKRVRSASLFSKRQRSRSRWQRFWRYYYWRLVRQKGSPEFLARGLAAGVFAGLFPLFGLQTILGVALAILFRGNKWMAVAGTWVSNPLTYGPIFWLNFEVGQWLLKSHEVFELERIQSTKALLEVGADFLIILFVGCLVMASFSAFLSYFLGLKLIRRWRTLNRGWRRRHHAGR
ncbi:DUF2062 domain-containing protein [Oscillatoria acuminata]|uniref:DUF2062 domain-containing protein n=1 Tax=Oscillatoria acuminata PCC 6304 TaxID=56110 RepID=K9TBM1_9CYAN|nr:DUF2062 domain-containing protein [Oscillatoria acuminata]AFY79945.1 hypothetical protein Oscil6304_0192 [Oscillatoria acuminata PCC 6304]